MKLNRKWWVIILSLVTKQVHLLNILVRLSVARSNSCGTCLTHTSLCLFNLIIQLLEKLIRAGYKLPSDWFCITGFTLLDFPHLGWIHKIIIIDDLRLDFVVIPGSKDGVKSYIFFYKLFLMWVKLWFTKFRPFTERRAIARACLGTCLKNARHAFNRTPRS